MEQQEGRSLLKRRADFRRLFLSQPALSAGRRDGARAVDRFDSSRFDSRPLSALGVGVGVFVPVRIRFCTYVALIFPGMDGRSRFPTRKQDMVPCREKKKKKHILCPYIFGLCERMSIAASLAPCSAFLPCLLHRAGWGLFLSIADSS